MCSNLQESLNRELKTEKEMIDGYAGNLSKKIGEIEEMRKNIFQPVSIVAGKIL